MSINDDILSEVADRVGTPAYVYDAKALRNRVAQLRTELPGVDFFYSLKANPNVTIVGLVTEQGMGAEVCSLFEIEASIAAGVAPEKIIFVGPAKSEAELTRAMTLGIKAIIAESLQELHRIAEIAARMGICQDIGLRINPIFHTPGARLSMSGKPTQFGIDETELAAALQIVGRFKSLRLAGMHVYMGTRILSHNVVVKNTRAILELAEQVTQLAGHPLDFVDIGGGFGVAYSSRETDLDLPALGAAMRPLLRTARARLPRTKIVIELGRYIVAEAGVFVTRVRYTKASKGTQFAICDGGSNCHTAAGQAAMFRNNFPVSRVGPETGASEVWTITGPLCTPTDTIGHQVTIAGLELGDLIRIDRSGAYGASASPVNFLSFGAPVEALVDDDKVSVIRERANLADYLTQQVQRPIEMQKIQEARLKETI
ncbi:MAG: type III PLP-dependent enzyme [Aliishimia sp.]